MKAVYRSIKPYWLYLILIGKKTIEVGKTFPKADDWNKEVFLHCSKDMKSFKRIPEKDREWMRKYLGKCACRFVCNEIETFRFDALEMAYMARKYRDKNLLDEEFFKGTQVTYQEAYDYCEGMTFDEEDTDYFYGWHISDLKIYDKPRELSEFFHYCGDNPNCDGCEAHYYSNTECGKEDYCCSPVEGCKPLKRPFQSWGYVEVQE